MSGIKYWICLFILSGFLPAYAQFEDVGELLLANDPLFDDKEIPEEWENESAIILGQKTRVLINENSFGYNKYWVTRTKILLQDKAAVEFFSDFTMSEGDAFEMKVIKPNGTVVEVDTSDAIPVSQGYSFTSFYVNLSLDKVDYKKLAIRNLEIGDIIDYAYASKELVSDQIGKSHFPLRLYNTNQTFLSYGYVFSSSYPKVAQEFEIELSPALYFNFKSMNGAPDPVVEPLPNGNLKYVIALDRVERIRSEYFTDSELTEPSIKFDVSFCHPMRYHRSKLIIAKPGVMNSTLPMEQFKRTLFLSFHPFEQEILDVFKFTESDPEKYIRRAYKKFQRLVYQTESDDYVQPSSSFARYMHAGLSEKGFNSEIVACIPRQSGDLEDLLLKDNVFFGVRVKKGDEYIYSFPFKRVSGFDDWDYRVTGTKAYAFKPTKKIQKLRLNEIEIPDYTPNQNKSLVKLKLSVDTANLTAGVSAETRHLGENKTLYSSDILQRADMYYDNETYFSEKLDRYYKRSDRIAELKRQDWLESQVESDFRLGDYQSFELKFSGMEDDTDVLEYFEEYTLTDVVHRAGKDHLVIDLGRLITGQIALSAEDMERHSDIISNYVREYEYTIEMAVPDGYKVLNLDDLSYDVETDAGAFRTELKDTGAGLTVRTLKTYKKRMLPKSEWAQMVEFLRAAQEFSQRKLVLIKE